MAINRYSRQIAPAQMRQMSFEDIARVPAAMFKYEMASREALDKMDLYTPAAPNDQAVARKVAGEIENQIADLSADIVKNGITQNKVNQVASLQSDYKKLTGPNGTLGRIKNTYEQYQNWAKEIDKINKDWSPDLLSAYKSQVLQNTRTFKEDDLEYLEPQGFSAGYLPSYISTPKRLNTLLQGLQASTMYVGSVPVEYQNYTVEQALNDPIARTYIDEEQLTTILANRALTDTELVNSAQLEEELRTGKVTPFVKEIMVEKDGKEVAMQTWNDANPLIRQIMTTAGVRAFDKFGSISSKSENKFGGQDIAGDANLGFDTPGVGGNREYRIVDGLFDNINLATTTYTASSENLSKQLDQGDRTHGMHARILGINYSRYFNPNYLVEDIGQNKMTLNDKEVAVVDYLNDYRENIGQLLRSEDSTPNAINNFVTSMSKYLTTEQSAELANRLNSILVDGDVAMKSSFKTALTSEMEAINNYNAALTGYVQSKNANAEYLKDLDKVLNESGSSLNKRLRSISIQVGEDKSYTAQEYFGRTLGVDYEKAKRKEKELPMVFVDDTKTKQGTPDLAKQDLRSIAQNNIEVLLSSGTEAFKQAILNEIDSSDNFINAEHRNLAKSKIETITEPYVKEFADLMIEVNPNVAKKLVEDYTVFNINEDVLSGDKYAGLNTKVNGMIQSVNDDTFLLYSMDGDGNPLTVSKILANEDNWETGSKPKSYQALINDDEIEVNILPVAGKARMALQIKGLKQPLIIDDSRSSTASIALKSAMSMNPNTKNSSIYFNLPEDSPAAQRVISYAYLSAIPNAEVAYHNLINAENSEKPMSVQYPSGKYMVHINYNPLDIKQPISLELRDKNGALINGSSPTYYDNIQSVFNELGLKYRNELGK